ncbi:MULTISPECIES: hypothetical protein [unclassified Streptomyces]|uniref:hypothetical protein n=1 Tax=unclassified Streptomyces TaxID=2593676 RepID=UPI002870467C|nr:hypothetical protein [Streptomyces sp. N2A]
MLSMADTQQADEQTAVGAAAATKDEKRAGKRAARLARQIRAFADSHGGSAEGQLAHIARGSVRIALVGANGEWGNLVARTYDEAKDAATRAGLTLHDDFDGDLAAKVRTGRYEWSRMAGLQLGGPANA